MACDEQLEAQFVYCDLNHFTSLLEKPFGIRHVHRMKRTVRIFISGTDLGQANIIKQNGTFESLEIEGNVSSTLRHSTSSPKEAGVNIMVIVM